MNWDSPLTSATLGSASISTPLTVSELRHACLSPRTLIPADEAMAAAEVPPAGRRCSASAAALAAASSARTRVRAPAGSCSCNCSCEAAAKASSAAAAGDWSAVGISTAKMVDRPVEDSPLEAEEEEDGRAGAAAASAGLGDVAKPWCNKEAGRAKLGVYTEGAYTGTVDGTRCI